MKSSHVTAIALALLASGLAALWLSLWDSDAASVQIASESDRVPAPETAAHELATRDDDLDLDTEWIAIPTVREEIAPPTESTDAAIGNRPNGVVRGRLRDAATGEALPDYLLRFSDAVGQREEVVTDGEGNFATKKRMVQGAVAVDFLDEPQRVNHAPEQRFDHLSRPDDTDHDLARDLAVESGPTFWLDLQPAREIEGVELEARLQYTGPQGRAVSDPARVRTGSGTWVRFAPLTNVGGASTEPGASDGISSESIDVTSRDGYWRGGARVQAARGRVAGIVAVKLAALAVLKVHLVDQNKSAVEGANLFLDWKNAAGKGSKAQGRSESNGTYTFKYLAEGEGTLSMRSVFCVPKDEAVRLVSKQTASIDAVLEKLPVAGGIRGSIMSETGTYMPDVGMMLSAPASASASNRGPTPLRTEVHWETVDGRKVGLFSFAGLPKGEYRLDPSHKVDFFRWEPPRLVVPAPNDGATFLVRDGVPNASLAFRVRDGDNGLSLDSFRVSLDVKGGPSRTFTLGSNQVLLEHLPYDRKLTWRVDKEDYQPAFGDESSFITEEMRGADRVHLAEVNLDPGWGDAFRVAHGQRNGGAPIEGAHILLDGRDAGVTGKDGTVRVFAKRKPVLVQCTYNDWNLAGKIDLSPPWSRSDKNFIRVDMRPPPKKK